MLARRSHLRRTIRCHGKHVCFSREESEEESSFVNKSTWPSKQLHMVMSTQAHGQVLLVGRAHPSGRTCSTFP